jgi:hypothetical protein
MKVGRPPKYESADELQQAIQHYFDNPPTKTVIVGKGENAHEVELPVLTISGLAYELGFESRQSFYDYEQNKEFSYTIKRARLFIENDYEKQLQVGNTVGAIFALKNFGWTDKQELDHTTKGQSITGFDYSKLSDATLKDLIAAARPAGTEE